jgi:restriction endonuclease S subunit
MGNVPNLRFPEFSEEWKKMKVSELLDFYSTNSLSWEQLDYNNGKIKNLHYGLIHKGVPTMVDVVCDSLPYIKEESMPKSFTLFKEGDVAFADASEDTNDVAKAIEVVNCDNQQIVSGLHTIHGRDNYEQTVIGYKGYAFASDSFHKQIRRIAQGTKVFSINTRNFDEVYIGIPSKEEQTKIAKLLIAIDKRIATQSKIIEDLKKLKSAITQKLLNSSTLLETHISLGEISELKNGYAFKSSTYCVDGIYKILTIANVQGNRYISTTDCKSISQLPLDLQEHQMLNEDDILISIDILISMTGNVGRVSLCQKGHFLLNQRVGLLKPLIKEREYLFQVLSCEQFEQSMIACGQGAAQMNIGKSDIDGFILPFSYCSDNLNYVAKVLRAYDNSIETNLHILNLFIRQKQYLLQQMFI